MPRRRRVATAEAPAQGVVGGGPPGGVGRGEGARWRPVTATRGRPVGGPWLAGWQAGDDLRKSGVEIFGKFPKISTHVSLFFMSRNFRRFSENVYP